MTYSIALVCLGNICRSPTAHVVLEQRLAEAGVDDVVVHSSGTGDWHTGEPMDPRSAAVLRDAGYDPSRHRARTFDAAWFADHDLILAMDGKNRRDMRALAPTPVDAARVRLFREFDPEASPEASEDDLDVPDPWYGGPEGFRDVLAMIERTAESLVDELDGLRSTSTR